MYPTSNITVEVEGFTKASDSNLSESLEDKKALEEKLNLESELLEIKLQNTLLTEANRRNLKIFNDRFKKNKRIDASYNGSFCEIHLRPIDLSNHRDIFTGNFNHDIRIRDNCTFAVTSAFSWIYNFTAEKYQGYAEGRVIFEYISLKSNLSSINIVSDLNLPYKLYLAAVKKVKDIPVFEYPKSYMDFIMNSKESSEFQTNTSFKTTVRNEYVCG